MGRVDISDIRRREIIDAATNILSDKGYHNTSIADIAAELDVGHGTLYRYFKNKLDIASCVIDNVIMRVTAVVLAEPPEDLHTLDDYRKQLERIGERFNKMLEDNPMVHRILFYESYNIDETITEKINGVIDLFASYTEMYLKTGIERGFLKPNIHTREAALAINVMLLESARRLCMEQEITDESKRAWSETIIGLMLDGLAV
jgi:AcrR family transcriptional regulator